MQARRTVAIFVLALTSLIGPSAWSAPTLTALLPASGPSRMLVAIDGQDLGEARVVWDADTPAARKLAPAVQGAVMFSVPAGSTPGPHAVRIERGAQRSQTLSFNVTGPAANATPRIDDISLAGSQFTPDGKVTVTLYVQGANIDTDAQVLVDGAPIDSQAHRALTTNLYGVAPAMLAFPIEHYLARVAALGPKPVGTQIEVQVKNEAGELSAKRTYRLPQSSVLLDSDGDGLTDLQETTTSTGAGGSVDLKALGVNPYRKDVLLELDLMKDVTPPIATKPGVPGTLDVARSVFENAPIMSPFGPRGIRLYIDATGTTDFAPLIDLQPNFGVVTLRTLRTNHFTPARRGAFHYAVWGQRHPANWSGYSNVDFTKGYGDSFLVTLGTFPTGYQTIRSQAETIVHELGHDLGQRHGGTDDYQYNPAYLSDMAYTWQLRASQGADFWRDVPTCTAFYYGEDRDELAAAPAAAQRVVIDYSQGMGADLTFGAPSLDERRGVCGRAIDWNRDATINDTPVAASPYDPWSVLPPPGPWVLRDYPNWANLRFDGPSKGIWP